MVDKNFTVDGVSTVTHERKPVIKVYRDPHCSGAMLAAFDNMNTEEAIDGYTYSELVSIRNILNEVLDHIDVQESIAEYNINFPKSLELDEWGTASSD